MLGKVVKLIGVIGFACSLLAGFLHPLPDGPAMFTGTPKVHQLLRDNPNEQELMVSRADLEAVLRDVQHQRELFKTSLTNAAILNVACIVLCYLLYRCGKRMERLAQPIDDAQEIGV